MNDASSQRALRKQLLRVRAAAERTELLHTASAVRQSATLFGKNGPALAVGKGLPLALTLLKRAPLLSPLLSLALSGKRRPALRAVALVAGAAWAGWKGWQWLGAQRASSPAADTAASSPLQDAPE